MKTKQNRLYLYLFLYKFSLFSHKMIIVSDKTAKKPLFVPISFYGVSPVKLELNNRGSNQTYEFVITDSGYTNYGFYSFDVDLSNVPDDEYEYKVFGEDDKVLASGIIRVNELNNTIEYYNKNIEYVYYDK